MGDLERPGWRGDISQKTSCKLTPDPKDTLGVLVSKSGFSQQAHVAALRATSAIMLVHLPFDYDSATSVSSSPLSSATISSLTPPPTTNDVKGKGKANAAATPPPPPIPVLGATYNPAFARFLALHGLELRRELRGATPGVGVWYAGSRMARFGPGVASLDAKRPGRPRKSTLEPGSVDSAAVEEVFEATAPRTSTITASPTPQKRGPGRPRKEATVAGSRAASTALPSTPKRGPGRPRKTPLPPDESSG